MLVEYSDSSSDEESVSNSQLTDKTIHRIPGPDRLPVPAFANGKTNSAIPDIDEQGRVRTFAHETGCWASYIYIDVTFRSEWEDVADSLCQLFNQRLNIECHLIELPHVSLTRTLKLRHHWLSDMKRDLHEIFHMKPKFVLGFNSVHIYTNDDKTRTFISVKVSLGASELKSLVNEIDKTILQYNQPVFYTNPSFHVSLCWCAGDESSKLQPLLSQTQNLVDDEFRDNAGMKSFFVDKILFKSGNKMFEFPLISD